VSGSSFFSIVDVVQLSKPAVTAPTVRVVVVADHDELQDALVDLLGDDPDIEIAGLARTVAGAVGQARALLPDVLLVDMDMAGSAGERVIAEVSGAIPEIRMVALSIRGDGETSSGFRSPGVDLHLPKGADVVDSMRSFFPK
jgi:DNA-binding NarL/FixJ family response regulator